MDEYISKKELLKETGISYGQLYRWKRMDIIPENWFIKRSSFTGQETYFPRDKILERVNKIIELKDEYSLEELAEFFSPNPSEVEISEVDLLSHRIVSEPTLRSFKIFQPNLKVYSFETIYYMYICQEIAKTKIISLEDTFPRLTFIQEYYRKHKQVSLDLIAIQKNQDMVWIMAPIQTPIALENQAKIMHTFNMLEIMNELNVKLKSVYSLTNQGG
jgi:hypothetical protein